LRDIVARLRQLARRKGEEAARRELGLAHRFPERLDQLRLQQGVARFEGGIQHGLDALRIEQETAVAVVAGVGIDKS
jgi:hypothetical protein